MSIHYEANITVLTPKPPEKSRNYWWSAFQAAAAGSLCVHSPRLFAPSGHPPLHQNNVCELAQVKRRK